MKLQQDNENVISSFRPGKWILLLFCYSFIHTFSQPKALQKTTSLTLNNIPMGDALDTLSAQTNMYFTYNAKLVDENKMVTIHQKSQPLSKVLGVLFNDSSLYFHVVKKQIIISDFPYISNPKTTVFSDTNQYQITGKVTDASTGKPIPYVNIGIVSKMVGTTTNNDGNFHLKFAKNYIGDTIKISFIGYKNQFIQLPDSTSGVRNITLQPNYISLQEVIIRSSDPKVLIRLAIEKFPENYMQNAANYTAFYRESVKKNRNYMIYLESILDIYKSPYNQLSFEKDAARILKGRKIHDVGNLDTVSFRLQGGVEGCLLMDVVRNKPDFLQDDLKSLYTFTLQNLSTYNELPVYVIDCTLKVGITEPLTEGRLFISVKDLAIIRAEFYYPQHLVKKLTNRFIKHKTAKTRATPIQLSYAVNYGNLNGQYYLSHSQGHLKFRVKNQKKLFSSTFHINFEMVTTRVDTTEVQKIKRSNRLKPDVILSKEMTDYDASFWGNATFIEPEEDIQKALMRIPATSRD